MIIVDTNVVSELVRPRPDENVLAWAQRTPVTSLATTATVLAEILDGLAQLPRGRRRTGLGSRLAETVTGLFGDRVLPFDDTAAQAYAEIRATRRRAGRPIAPPDTQIAAVSLVHDASLVTRNVRDFEDYGVRLLDPWAP